MQIYSFFLENKNEFNNKIILNYFISPINVKIKTYQLNTLIELVQKSRN